MNQFTLSTVPAVAPEARTLSCTTQPGGSQLGLSEGTDLGEASGVALEADNFLGAGESPFPGAGASGGSFLPLRGRGSARNGDRREGEGGSGLLGVRWRSPRWVRAAEEASMKEPGSRRGSGGREGKSGRVGSWRGQLGSGNEVPEADMWEEEEEEDEGEKTERGR